MSSAVWYSLMGETGDGEGGSVWELSLVKRSIKDSWKFDICRKICASRVEKISWSDEMKTKRFHGGVGLHYIVCELTQQKEKIATLR